MTREELDQAIPSLRDRLEPDTSLPETPGNREYVVLHEDEKPVSGDTDLSGRYVSGLVHVNRSPEEVTRCVTNFDSHEDFIKLYRNVSLLEETEDLHRVNYEAEVEMALLTLNVSFQLVYHPVGDHEWIWTCEGGDLETYQGRIELVPTDDGTRIVLTSWIDLSGVSWLLDTVLWAQPDLRVALPATMTSILINGFYQRLANDPLDPPDDASPSEPSPPRLEDVEVFPGELDSLLELGTVLLFHPRQRVGTPDGFHDTLYTTGFRSIEESREHVQDELSDFETYPTFIDQVDRVETRSLEEGFRSEWFFKLGLGLLSIPISFTIDYHWETDHRLVFEMVEGHFDVIAGSLEWYELPGDKTVYAITSGSYIGEDAPRLVQLANAIPYRELFMGTTLSTVILQKSKNWLEKN